MLFSMLLLGFYYLYKVKIEPTDSVPIILLAIRIFEYFDTTFLDHYSSLFPTANQIRTLICGLSALVLVAMQPSNS